MSLARRKSITHYSATHVVEWRSGKPINLHSIWLIEEEREKGNPLIQSIIHFHLWWLMDCGVLPIQQEKRKKSQSTALHSHKWMKKGRYDWFLFFPRSSASNSNENLSLNCGRARPTNSLWELIVFSAGRAAQTLPIQQQSTFLLAQREKEMFDFVDGLAAPAGLVRRCVHWLNSWFVLFHFTSFHSTKTNSFKFNQFTSLTN